MKMESQNNSSVVALNRNNSLISSSSSEMDEELMLHMENMEESRTGSLRHQDSHQSQNSLNSQLIRPNLMTMVHHKWRKMWKRDSAEITQNDPSFKAIYLGNVLTTWAKGEGCLDRPASALWKNHCQGRGSIKMVISVAPSGLKAQTREHGLTEYWANRLTWCGVPQDYPKLFCWIYRHEGRKLKQELRCHAVLCSKEERAHILADSLRNRLTEALFDFKKEKILRQNARLSIVQSLYNTSNTKRRPILLNSNSQNYKPPLERSKSAPKLSCIEEFEEEFEEDDKDTFKLCHLTIQETEVSVSSPQVYINSMPQSSMQNGQPNLVSSPSQRSTFPEEEEKENYSLESSPQRRSPLEHRKSYAHPIVVAHHPEGSRRPHTVPMDAKLNLPYMTGYDKVMHLLDMPTNGDSHHILLDGDDEEFFPGSNSDPVASSPGSDACESVVDSCCEDEFGKHIPRRRGSTDRKAVDEGSPGEDEINDNVSDESGYSEEATVVIRHRNNSGNGTENHHHGPKGSPSMKKKSSTNKNNFKTSTTIIRGSEAGDRKSSSSSNGESCPTTTLVVYDNLCFEI